MHRLPIGCSIIVLSLLLGAGPVLAQGSLGSSLDPAVEAALADEAKRVPPPPAPEPAAEVVEEGAAEAKAAEDIVEIAPVPGEEELVEGQVGAAAAEDPAAAAEEEPAAAAAAEALADDAAIDAEAEQGLADDPVSQSFRTFCREWMDKLAERERRNEGLIEWQAGENFVLGSYVGYTRDHTCIVDSAQSNAPVGKISYLEIKYEKRGATQGDAQIDRPHPVETTEVTEFFRYGDGNWIY